MNDQRLSILILSAVGMATTFMPWVKLPVLGYMLGTNYYGWVTFAIFLSIFILALIGDRAVNLPKLRLYALIFLSLFAAAIGVWKIVDLDGPLGTVEYGLYLMSLIGVVLPITVFIMRRGKDISKPKKGVNEFSYKTEIDKKGAPD